MALRFYPMAALIAICEGPKYPLTGRIVADPELGICLLPQFAVPQTRSEWRSAGAAPSLQLEHGRSRVPSLQAMDRGRTRARLLDNHRSGSDPRSLGGSAGCLGAAARDRRFLWRSADLRIAQVDHVLPQVLLLLCASEEELSRTLRVSRSQVEGSSS